MEAIAVQCPTKELWDKVRKKIDPECSHSFTWSAWKENSCFKPDAMLNSCINICNEQGYTIISAEEYLKEGEGFKVGDRVKCIDISFLDGVDISNYMELGGIYTIKAIFTREGCCDRLKLEEVESPTLTPNSNRFKLANKPKTTNKEEAMSKDNNVNKAVQKVFGGKKYTGEQMLLVDKHLGGEIKTDTLSTMLLEDKADKILTVVNDMEKKELAEAKKD